jgi:hypothetical protein
MREITLFWKRVRLIETDIAPLLDIVNSAVFLAYIKRTPKDIRMLMKTNFKPGKNPEDLNSLYFFELLDIHHSPEDGDDSYVLNVRLNHPLSNFNARTGGTTAAPGCRLDGEGLTYILQGGNIRLRLVAAMARLMAKPDRISARKLDFSTANASGPLSAKQLKLAKYAYDCGWYDFNKRVRISDMAEDLNLARATLAEHLSRIESIVMDDMMGSFSNIKIHPDEYSMFKEMVELDAEDEYSDDKFFKKLLTNIHANMDYEDTQDADNENI